MKVKKSTGWIQILAAVGFAAQAGPPSRPNILLIVTDDENPDLVGSYDGSVHTPHIDRIARNGVRFTNANVVHTVCSPSRYAILTGRYYDNTTWEEFLRQYPPGQPSCIRNAMVLQDGQDNLVSVLRRNGYVTAHIGKYHLGENHHLLFSTNHWAQAGLQTYPRDADPRLDPKVNAAMKANHAWWVERIKEDGFDHADAVYAANLRELFNEHLNVHNIEWTTDATVRFIRGREGKEQPFFLTVNTTYPHGPKPEWERGGRFIFSLDADVQLTGEGHVTDRDLSGVLAGETRESVKRFLDKPGMSDKAAFATWWDAGVGAMLDALRETGQYENTMVVYISDHGLHDNGKSTLYETGVHVPLLIQWPARIPGGQEYHPVVGSIDLAPTLFHACGIPLPDGYVMDGVSLFPALEGCREPVREALLLQMGYARGVKTDRWKYIAVRYPAEVERMINDGIRDPSWAADGDEEPPAQPYWFDHLQLARRASLSNPHYFARNQLFDLEKDPEEQINRFDQMPEKARQMRQLLTQAGQRHFPHRPFGEFTPCDDPDAFREAANAVRHPPHQETDCWISRVEEAADARRAPVRGRGNAEE